MKPGDLILTNDGYFGIVMPQRPEKHLDHLINVFCSNGTRSNYIESDLIPLPLQVSSVMAQKLRKKPKVAPASFHEIIGVL